MFHQCCFVSAQGPNSASEGIQSLFRYFIVAQFIMHKTSLLIYIPVISPTWCRAHAIASGKCPGSLFQISRRAIALIVSIWPLKQTWGFSSTVKAATAFRRSETLPSHDHAAGPSEKANAYMPPRVLFHARHKAPCIMHVQCKDAAIAHCSCEPDDELKRGNHLTLPKQEYDTSRPAT